MGGGGVRQPLINSQVMNALPGMVTVALSLRSLSRVRGAQCGRRGLWHGRARDPAQNCVTQLVSSLAPNQ